MKTKRYWLKGGIIAEVIFLAFAIVSYLSGQIEIVNYRVQCLIAPCWYDLHFYLFGSKSFIRKPQVTVLLIGLIVLSFIVGTIMGWIYGRVKDKRLNAPIN